MGALSRLAGSGGSEYVAGAKTGKNYNMIVVQEDTVISVMSGTSDSNTAPTPDFVSDQGISGITLKQGAILTVPAGSVITSLTVASWSVIAYNAAQQW